MKRSKIALLGFSLVLTSLIISCNKTNNEGACFGYLGWALAVQDEATALSTAASAYSQDPTTENCEKYRQAYSNYIDALDSQGSCVPSDQNSDFQKSLDDARSELSALNC